MDDLIVWLRAQLDDDERRALALPEHRRTWQTGGGWPETGATQVLAGDYLIVEDDTSWGEETVTHIARWDPARVLAEVDAKRRILDQLLMWLRGHDPKRAHEFPGTTAGVAALLTTVRLLALPYADRPGYRDDWRP